MVYYRKYRPQNLEELVGQEHIVQTLTKAFQQNRLAQAYLFCGPKGTGKTSTARILAKIVNCPKVGNDNCEICISIADGSNMDLIEIDAASNRGIDDIREIRERVKLAPTSLNKKVYIIDEVHMLSNEAFNALLKTLEEPPAHVLFILATTEVHKIPETILSRVQRLDFKAGTVSNLMKALKKVVDGEGLTIDNEALMLIAKKSSGGFRDGIKLLDQLSSIDKKITIKMIEETLRSSDLNQQLDLLTAISKKDTTKGLELVSSQVELGINIKEYIISSMDILRDILFIKNNLGANIKDDIGTEKYQKITELSDKLSINDLIKIINCFQQALEKMRVTSIPSLPLEVAIVEACLQESSKTDTISVKTEPPPVINHKSLIINQTQVYTESEEPAPMSASPADSPDMTILKDKWVYILETIKPHNYSLEAMLKLAKVLECKNSLVTLEVPYAFHQRIMDAPKSRGLLESVLSDVLGKGIKVSTVLGKRPVKTEELANVEVAADDEVIRIAAEIFNAEPIN